MALTQVQGGMLQGSTNTTTTIQSNGTTAITIDSTQKVGIGTASPSAKLHVTQSGNPIAQFTRSDSGTGLVIASDSDGPYFRPETSSAIRFNNSANTVENMRIDSSGNVLIGVNSSSGFNSPLIVKSTDSQDTCGFYRTTTQVNYGMIRIYSNVYSTQGEVCQIRASGNLLNYNNSYGSLSDVSLKENIVDATPKLNNLLQVKIRNFNLKSDVTNTKQIGVIAQELEEIFPSMVEADENGIKSVKYSVFVPMLIKAIQELKAELDATKAEVAALKAAP